MLRASLPVVLRRLTAPVETDAALLERYAQGDDAAFTALVDRHGPMVLGVCRRTLGDRHAAEDACQAVFLVLARKAAGLTRPAELAGWLHAVARRTALKARRAGPRPLPESDPPDRRPD